MSDKTLQCLSIDYSVAPEDLHMLMGLCARLCRSVTLFDGPLKPKGSFLRKKKKESIKICIEIGTWNERFSSGHTCIPVNDLSVSLKT